MFLQGPSLKNEILSEQGRRRISLNVPRKFQRCVREVFSTVAGSDPDTHLHTAHACIHTLLALLVSWHYSGQRSGGGGQHKYFRLDGGGGGGSKELEKF